jgi:hypothetical protein
MQINGRWYQIEHGDGWDLRLGNIFTARIRRRGGNGIYAGRWEGVLNGQPIADTSDLDYAKGLVERQIVVEMTNLSEAYRALKTRAPTGDDLHPDGAWSRWKEARKPG